MLFRLRVAPFPCRMPKTPSSTPARGCPFSSACSDFPGYTYLFSLSSGTSANICARSYCMISREASCSTKRTELSSHKGLLRCLRQGAIESPRGKIGSHIDKGNATEPVGGDAHLLPIRKITGGKDRIDAGRSGDFELKGAS